MRKQMESKRDPIVRDFHNQLDDLVEAVLMQVRACRADAWKSAASVHTE